VFVLVVVSAPATDVQALHVHEDFRQNADCWLLGIYQPRYNAVPFALTESSALIPVLSGVHAMPHAQYAWLALY